MFDQVLGFGRVVASSVEGDHSFTLFNVDGISDLEGDDSEGAGETAPGEENYQALGIIGRPLPPDGEDSLEALFARTGDGMVPFAYRDPRLHRHYPNPGEGDLAFVSYGGGFHSMSLNDNGETIHTLYAPYEYSGGTPQKAHAVIMDPSEGVSFVHAEGHAVLLTSEGNVILKNVAGDAYAQIGADGITLNGNTVLNGGATIGDPVGALPATIAPHVVTYLTALETLLATLASAIDAVAGGGVNAAAVSTFVGSQAATKAAMPATKASVA